MEIRPDPKLHRSVWQVDATGQIEGRIVVVNFWPPNLAVCCIQVLGGSSGNSHTRRGQNDPAILHILESFLGSLQASLLPLLMSFLVTFLNLLLGPTSAPSVAVIARLGEDDECADNGQHRGDGHSYGEVLLDLPRLRLDSSLTLLLVNDGGMSPMDWERAVGYLAYAHVVELIAPDFPR